MKKKNKGSLMFLIAVVIGLGAISFSMKSSGENQKKIEEIQKPVKTQIAKNEFVYTKHDYIGIVNSKEYIKYSFELPGKIDKIFVKKGQFVEVGENLLEINRTDLKYALESENLKFTQSSITLEKTKESMNSMKDNFDRAIAMYETGSISKNSYDEVEFNYTMASKNFENAKSNYKLAKIGLDKSQNDFDKGILKSKKSGIISDILIEEGEITDAGIPVIILRDSTYVVNIGVAKDDLKNINLGDSVDVNIDETYVGGIISEINELPDIGTGLYLVKVQIEDGDYIIGKECEATFNIDERKGVKVPLSAIGTEDYDYVFLEKDNRSLKHKVEIIGIYKDFILINGIDENEKIVIEGMRALDDGDYIRNLE